MKMINVENIEISIDNKQIIKMKESIIMNNNTMLIRNKREVQKLSKKVEQSTNAMRRRRYMEALQDNDYLYLQNYYKSLSAIELLKMLIQKI